MTDRRVCLRVLLRKPLFCGHLPHESKINSRCGDPLPGGPERRSGLCCSVQAPLRCPCATLGRQQAAPGMVGCLSRGACVIDGFPKLMDVLTDERASWCLDRLLYMPKNGGPVFRMKPMHGRIFPKPSKLPLGIPSCISFE
jgi:hypothetical protein